jgi:hypothetical protein
MDKLINDKNNNRKGNSMTDSTATAESAQAKPSKDNGQPPVNGKSQTKPQAKYGRVISDPNEVAHLVMMRINHVNSKKDELTIAVKALADTAKQLVGTYANQQAQIAKLTKRVEELEKTKDK